MIRERGWFGSSSGRSAAELHRSWLELVNLDGPFVSVPVLRRVWPQGMPQMSADARAVLAEAKPAFERAWEGWDRQRADEATLAAYRSARDLWVETVLRDVIGWGENYMTDLPSAGLADSSVGVRSPDRAITVIPTGAAVRDGEVAALVLVVDPVDSLRDPLDDGWAAGPLDRMELLLRDSRIPTGIVTDGRWWALVSARPDTMVASGIVDAQIWIEEPETRDAFTALLSRQRLLGGRPEDRLTVLFGESVAAAEEITDALGTQVRRAVELLVQAFSEEALEKKTRSEVADPLPADRDRVYEAAVTVMMRVVFLLFAEERGLLPQGQLFAAGYGISSELSVLDQRARDEGAEALDATHMTWHRLLATSRALYRGATFEDMRMPSYGGSLFDPRRYPFLGAVDDGGALSVAVSDRVMLEVLRAVQVARVGGELRPISFRDIDVEQIGYIYEGLLGYSCAEAGEVTVGLIGKDGEEPEIPLARLENLAAEHAGDGELADAILAWTKQDQPASKPPTKAALAKAYRKDSEVEDAERALRAATTDADLRERLRPFLGIIRRDLRGRPYVVPQGGLVVMETPSRATAGAHYTPRSLAEEVVKHALHPLMFDPGPHQTADESRWRPISSERILDLKVADIACGSGAFLVAAARYLAGRLIEAWKREGVAVGSAREQETHAIRQVVAQCLYGADINEMAVEMGKLSLWLVSLDPKLPFSFVDDKVLHGNSLMGLTDPRQLEALNIDPTAASGQLSVLNLDIDGVLDDAARLRGRLASEVDNDNPQQSAATKRRQWREYQERTRPLADVADGVIAAGLRLGGKPGRPLIDAYENLRIAVERAFPGQGVAGNQEMLDSIVEAGLTPTVPTDYERWQPLHWVLAVPDVMSRGGFDAIIGNPPFLGAKKITPALGSNAREWFVNVLANRVKGNADLVSYFFLRAATLLSKRGMLGLIATNSIAQGDTREVGLDRMVTSGFKITRAIQSKRWPAASANLEYAAVWGTFAQVAEDAELIMDDIAVSEISTLLEPAGRVFGNPVRLVENTGIAFQGCVVLGKGFVLAEAQADEMIASDPKNAEVLFPYLNGDDLNSCPGSLASRWVIDFGELDESSASKFDLPWRHVEDRVKPERIKKDGEKYPRMVYEWWKFWNARPGMRSAISELDEVLAITRHSSTVAPLRVASRQVHSDALAVFATESYSDQAVLSSSAHQVWAVVWGSTFGTGVRYTTSSVFETYPRPSQTDRLDAIGRTFDAQRREVMRRRNLGLTRLYNLVNDPDITDDADKDVSQMRQLHVELDEAVMDAYCWSDVPLEHGFHTYRQTTRWTIGPAARVEILDRLLEENHRRAVAQGAEAMPVGDEGESEE